MSSLEPKQRWTLGIGAALLTLLLSAVFTFGSLDVPFEPKSWREAMALYTVSTFITAALLVFLLILTRTVLRLWAERSKEQLGARFKTKMVVGAMALSLLPVLFMFLVSYSLLNRTLGRWFPRPLEIASEQTQTLLNDLGRNTTLPRVWMLFGGSTKTARQFTAVSFATTSRRTAAAQFVSTPEFSATCCARCPAASRCGKRRGRIILWRVYLLSTGGKPPGSWLLVIARALIF